MKDWMAPSEWSLRRRELLATLAASAIFPAQAKAGGAKLRPMLERAAAQHEPSAMIASLKRDERGSLDRGEAAIHDMVLNGLEQDLALRKIFPFGKVDGTSPYVLSHRHGAYLELNERSAPAMAGRLDEETGRIRAESGKGIVPPAFLIERVLETERRLLQLVSPELRPALARQVAILDALPRAPGDGVWRVPHGPDYYAARLRCSTGSTLAPAKLDRIVMDETRQLRIRAGRLFAGVGISENSVGAAFRTLKRRTDAYSNDDAGRDRAVADMNAALTALRPRLAQWFDPPLELASKVRRMTASEEEVGKRGYRDAPGDGRPGTYFPDLAAPGDRPRWTLVTVAHHETIPGHMLQLRHQAAADPHPLQLRYAAGYSEGWAIYAESLVDRIGLLSPVEQLGFIQSSLFRLARVTADIGIHLHRWDRTRAIHYLEDTVGFELFFPFAVEVDRYCAEPGGFAGDALAAITLRRIGAARMHKGPAVLRQFHGAMLNHGPISPPAIEVLAT